jgi:type I restriction enzyme, R subunit
MQSLNFEFLRPHEPLLVKLGAAAERYCFEDPNVSLFKLRQFGELLAQMVAQMVRVSLPTESNQNALLRELSARGVIRGDVERLFHEIRRTGNDAVHGFTGTQRVALETLHYGHFLGIWFQQSFGGVHGVSLKESRTFKPAFVAPKLERGKDGSLERVRLQQEIDRLNQALAEQVDAAVLAKTEQLKQEQLLVALEVEREQSALEQQQIQARLQQLEVQAQAQTSQKIQTLVNQAADTVIDLDEAATRRLIDQQLRRAGWEVDSEGLTYAGGTRPEKGRNLAISEYPVGRRSADYVLFIGLEAVAVIEAKRRHKAVQSGALGQAIERYARKFPTGVLPFVFATNGKPFQRQIQSESGIWFQDLRRDTNLSRAIVSWFRPEDLQQMLKQDMEEAEAKLRASEFPVDLGLYDYQRSAIQSVEQAILDQRREILLAMATGTGKTRTAIALCYRLLTSDRVRRILFLVDRSILRQKPNFGLNLERTQLRAN